MIYNFKTASRFSLRTIFLLIIILFVSFESFAEEKKWTVSAVEFTYSQDIKRNDYEKSLLKAIPQLILDQLNGLKSRNVPSSEVFDREIDKYIKERLALFLELSSETKKRDSYVLQNISEYQFNKYVKESEKKIKDIQKKIDSNLEEQEKLLNDPSKFKDRLEEFEIYKNDTETLFTIPADITNSDFNSYQFSSEVTKVNINAVITGSVITYGNYCAVSVEMFVYPGAQSTGVITEVGSISKIENVAKNISYRLIPKIENAIPCDVQIKFTNEDLRKKTKLTVDNTIYSPVPEKIVIGNGVHNITFECEGFRKESFSYGFGYEKKYVIEIDFVEDNSFNTAVVLKNPIGGTFYYNGNTTSSNELSVKVNNMSVLGYYFTDNENSLFFRIPEKILKDTNIVSLNLKDIDIGANIEKRRKVMYISYSALICSLPFLFYSYSNYNNLYRSYYLGQPIDMNEFTTYQTMSYIGIGLSVSMGCWFLYELVRYLIAANKALPVEAKKSSSNYETSVQEYLEMQERFRIMKEEELERQKLEEEKKAALEAEKKAALETEKKAAEEAENNTLEKDETEQTQSSDNNSKIKTENTDTLTGDR
nr:hypothetical protein [uncultured Treponema sp.]